MKKALTIFLWLASLMPLLAQAPLGFNYQGIARQSDGTPISNQTIGIRVSITEGAQGTSQFTEEHFPETNEFGLFTLVVGQGNGNSTLNSVDWSGGNLWLQIELDPDNMGDYILMGSQQLMSVPYALYAQQSGGGLSPGYGIDITNGIISNVLPPVTVSGGENITVTGSYPNYTINGTSTADGDADPSNELQTISKTGNEVILSNGGGSFIDAVDDADADATNEIQDLQLSGNILTITNNGTPTSIDLSPYLDNTDTQLTEAEVDAYANDNGYLTSEVDGSTTNELQNLSSTPSGTNRTINISGGTGTTISVADNDNSASNELITGGSYQPNNTLRITEAGVNTDISLGTLNADLNADNNTITNLADPVNGQDAVNLQYLEQKDATDYAISVPISFTSSGSAGNVSLDLSGATIDQGNLISTSTVTVVEAGVYIVSISGKSNLAIGSDMNIVVNGGASTTAIYKINNYYFGTYMLDLSALDDVEIIVSFSASVEQMDLKLALYKI